MLHVARPAYIGYQMCARCLLLLCRPPDTPWPAGALVSVLTPTDSDPATPCQNYEIELAAYQHALHVAAGIKSRADHKRVTIETTPNDSQKHARQRQE